MILLKLLGCFVAVAVLSVAVYIGILWPLMKKLEERKYKRMGQALREVLESNKVA